MVVAGEMLLLIIILPALLKIFDLRTSIYKNIIFLNNCIHDFIDENKGDQLLLSLRAVLAYFEWPRGIVVVIRGTDALWFMYIIFFYRPSLIILY